MHFRLVMHLEFRLNIKKKLKKPLQIYKNKKPLVWLHHIV